MNFLSQDFRKVATLHNVYNTKIEIYKKGNKFYKKVVYDKDGKVFAIHPLTKNDLAPHIVSKAATDDEELLLLTKFFKVLEILELDPKDFIEHIKQMGYDDLDIYLSLTLVKKGEEGNEATQKLEWSGNIDLNEADGQLKEYKTETSPTKLDEFYNMLFSEFIPGRSGI